MSESTSLSTDMLSPDAQPTRSERIVGGFANLLHLFYRAEQVFDQICCIDEAWDRNRRHSGFGDFLENEVYRGWRQLMTLDREIWDTASQLLTCCLGREPTNGEIYSLLPDSAWCLFTIDIDPDESLEADEVLHGDTNGEFKVFDFVSLQEFPRRLVYFDPVCDEDEQDEQPNDN